MDVPDPLTSSPSQPDPDGVIAGISRAIRHIIEGMQSLELLHDDNVDDLVDRSVRYLRAFLRSLPPEDLSFQSEAVLSRRLLLKTIQLLYPASIPVIDKQPQIQKQLPTNSGLSFLIHEQPKYQVGGDLARVDEAAEGGVWILLADVTGKSVAAYLTAATLEAAWDMFRETRGNSGPLKALHWLESELFDHLPTGVFVEAIVARIKDSRDVDMAAAGFIQFLSGTIPAVTDVKFGGPYLGMGCPDQFTERTQILEPDDEILLATDGVFEQPYGEDLLRDTLRGHVNSSEADSIHNAVIEVIGAAFQQGPQRDDLTIISFRRTR